MIEPAAPNTITVRYMTLEDAPRVHAIDVASFTLPWSERSFRYELTENKHSTVWVAEIQEASGPTLCGVIVTWIILDEAHIATIAVHPDYRQRGIARQLLARALSDAYTRGARLALLEVRRSNIAAQTLYLHFGFVVVGERPRYYQDNNEDALLMTLEKIDPQHLENQ